MTPLRRMFRWVNLEGLAFAAAALSALVLIWALLSPSVGRFILALAGLSFVVCVVALTRTILNPESARASQTDVVLRMASLSLEYLKEGLTYETAHNICELLLPNTSAIAVAITDRQTIMGYVGYLEEDNPPGSAIRTQATHEVIADGEMRVIYQREEIGFPGGSNAISAAIIVPLKVANKVVGTLKFYYRRSSLISETRKSLAHGFGQLISTQLAAIEMETQRKMATQMELRMLQSQINPHFLFNTINTISALIRTDPIKARTLLREFAVFYRRTLENSTDQIPLLREIEQTMRYFSFEVARFGDERLELYVAVPEELEDVMVPPFIIQPMVENAVKHGLPSEGKLKVTVFAHSEDGMVTLEISDDGKGMDEEHLANLMSPQSETGLGIAVKNVHDRLKGFYGETASMEAESKIGEGTTIFLRFPAVRAVKETTDEELEGSSQQPSLP